MSRTIGKVAKSLNINIETIRFYEKRGLIEQPLKPETGYRVYPEDTINRIRFIKNAQQLGFTLKEILNLLEVNDKPCHVVENLAKFKLISVQQKMEQLQSLESALRSLLIQCQSNKDEDNCPIIDALVPHNPPV